MYWINRNIFQVCIPISYTFISFLIEKKTSSVIPKNRYFSILFILRVPRRKAVNLEKNENILTKRLKDYFVKTNGFDNILQ